MPEDDVTEARRFAFSPGWLGLGISVFIGVYQFGVANGAVNENTRRVAQLEATDRQRGDSLARIDARTARIEATLDVMRTGARPYRPLSEAVPDQAP